MPAAPAPADHAVRRVSPARLAEQGWTAIEEGEYEKARHLFDGAISGGVAGKSLYGRAYANEKLGNAGAAVRDYCRAMTDPDAASLRVEIEGNLARLGAACPS
jgi:hypothetical protein